MINRKNKLAPNSANGNSAIPKNLPGLAGEGATFFPARFPLFCSLLRFFLWNDQDGERISPFLFVRDVIPHFRTLAVNENYDLHT